MADLEGRFDGPVEIARLAADKHAGQVERRLPKLLDQLAGVRLVARGRQLVMNGQSHVVSLAIMVQRPGQSVTHEIPLAVPLPTSRLGC
ncbi:MAG: hypothetical protein ACLQU3_17350 [Limisphaerales bacterium]